MTIKYSITNDTITVFDPKSGETHTINQDVEFFKETLHALIDGRYDDVLHFITPASSLYQWSDGEFRVEGGQVKYKDDKLPAGLNDRIVKMVEENRDPQYLIKFWKRLKKNPSLHSVVQLFDFLKNSGIPITEDGTILAYKSVKLDFRDHHTGRVDNRIGVINEMSRDKISDDPTKPCHFGFHVGALEYARNFVSCNASVLIICEVDPADVVCVPYDYSRQKMRVCKYKVIGLHGDELPSTVFSLSDECIGPSRVDDFISEDEEDENYDDGESQSFVPTVEEELARLQELMARKRDSSSATPSEERLEKKNDPWDHFHDLEKKTLETITIRELRAYARHGLNIIGASRISGGKSALIEAIMNARRVLGLE